MSLVVLALFASVAVFCMANVQAAECDLKKMFGRLAMEPQYKTCFGLTKIDFLNLPSEPLTAKQAENFKWHVACAFTVKHVLRIVKGVDCTVGSLSLQKDFISVLEDVTSTKATTQTLEPKSLPPGGVKPLPVATDKPEVTKKSTVTTPESPDGGGEKKTPATEEKPTNKKDTETTSKDKPNSSSISMIATFSILISAFLMLSTQ